MSWEELPIQILTPRPSSNECFRRCTNCGSIGHCPPSTPCRLCRKGTLDRQPGWKTRLAPRNGNDEPDIAQYPLPTLTRKR